MRLLCNMPRALLGVTDSYTHHTRMTRQQMAALLQGHIDDEIAEVDSIKKDIQDTIKHVEDMCNSLGLEAELVIPRPTSRFTHTCAQTGSELQN